MYHARRVRGSEASARLDKNIEDHCVRMLLLFEPLRERPTRNVFHRNEYLVFEGADVVQCNHVGCESRASACLDSFRKASRCQWIFKDESHGVRSSCDTAKTNHTVPVSKSVS